MTDGPPIPADLPEELRSSLARLWAAGIVAWVTLDADGTGVITWTTDYHLLLMSGRRPETEPGFQAAWREGTAAVRAWITAEAAALRDRSEPER